MIPQTQTPSRRRRNVLHEITTGSTEFQGVENHREEGIHYDSSDLTRRSLISSNDSLLSFRYWEDIEAWVLAADANNNNRSVSFYQRKSSSNIIWIPTSVIESINFTTSDNNDNSNNNNNHHPRPEINASGGGIRIGRMVSFLSRNFFREHEWKTIELTSAMAVRDFNARTSPFGTHMMNRSQNTAACNFYLTMGPATLFSNVHDLALQYQNTVLLHGVDDFRTSFGWNDTTDTDTTNGTNATSTTATSTHTATLRAMAILGGAVREKAVVLGQLGSVTPSLNDKEEENIVVVEGEGVMVMSPTASNTHLDGAPLFARTITSTRPFAVMLCRYLKSINIQFLGAFFSNDGLGASYALDLAAIGSENGIQVVPVSYSWYDNKSDAEWEIELNNIRNTGLMYFCGVFGDDHWADIVRQLYDGKLLGVEDRVWFFEETVSLGMMSAHLDMANEEDAQLVRALNRTAVFEVESGSEANVAIFEQALTSMLQDEAFLEYWSTSRENQSSLEGFEPSVNIFSMLAYDAVMATGLAACETNDTHLFTGGDLYSEVTLLNFAGASGNVSFSSNGTREPDGLVFQISNLFFHPKVNRSSNNSRQWVHVVNVPCFELNMHDDTAVHLRNLTLPNGSLIPPPATDAGPVNTNPVPIGISSLNFFFAAVVILLSLMCAGWTIMNRNSSQVRAAQPLFLVIVCIGTFMIGISMVLATYKYFANFDACMAYTWLFSLGVALIFSALFAKTWRIYQVFKTASRFRRVEIRAKDVMWPIFAVCGLEIIVLITWTLVAPLEYEAYPVAYDRFGNVIETTSSCISLNHSSSAQVAFLFTTVAISVFILIVSAYQSYRARNLPTEFNESRYLAFTKLILLESFIIGLPVLFLASDSPSSFSLVMNFLLLIVCLAVLLPVFVPKFTSASDFKKRRFLPTGSDNSNSNASIVISNVITRGASQRQLSSSVSLREESETPKLSYTSSRLSSSHSSQPNATYDDLRQSQPAVILESSSDDLNNNEQTDMNNNNDATQDSRR